MLSKVSKITLLLSNDTITLKILSKDRFLNNKLYNLYLVEFLEDNPLSFWNRDLTSPEWLTGCTQKEQSRDKY